MTAFSIEVTSGEGAVQGHHDSPSLDEQSGAWIALRQSVKALFNLNAGVTRVEFSAATMPYGLQVHFNGDTITYTITPPSHAVDSGGFRVNRIVYDVIADLRERLVFLAANHQLSAFEATRA